MALGKKTGGGSRKGVPNRATRDVRAAIALFAETNADRLQAWLDDIAKENPAKAAELYVRVLEYHIPKLARTEIEGEIGVRGRLIIDG